MRLRANEVCPIHQSLSCCGRELLPKPRLVRLGSRELKIPATRVDIVNFGRGRDPKVAEPEGSRTRWQMHDLPRRVHRPQRHCSRSQKS